MMIIEGKAKISAPDGVFYNPAMASCRDIASLWVGTLPGKISICDGFCASGIRGIRYARENANVKSVRLVDMSKKAIAACRKNIRANKLARKAKALNADIRAHLLGMDLDYSLVEIDPFGSPAPYLHDVVRFGDRRKDRYLSITATDMAVLCGAHFSACVKNYSSRPLDNEFCHENAARILIGKLAREASGENYGVEVEFTLSNRHYVKIFVRLEPGAEKAVESAKSAMMNVSFCRKCGWRKMGRLPESKCGNCKNAKIEWAGPMWGGKIFDKNKIAQMLEKADAAKKTYTDEARKILHTALEEADGAAFYYDLHEMASRMKKGIPRIADAVEGLGKAGFFASRTHFSPTAVRTDAGMREVAKAMK